MVVRQWELRRGAGASWRSRRGQELPDPGHSTARVHPRRVGGFYVRSPGRRVRSRADGRTVTAGRSPDARKKDGLVVRTRDFQALELGVQPDVRVQLAGVIVEVQESP